MPDCELAAYAVDPFLEANQSTEGGVVDEMNVAQIQNQMIPRF